MPRGPDLQHVRSQGDPAEAAQRPDCRLRRHHGPVPLQHYAPAQEGTHNWRWRRGDDLETVEAVPQYSGHCRDPWCLVSQGLRNSL